MKSHNVVFIRKSQQLRGNPVLVANLQHQPHGPQWPPTAIKLYRRVARSGERGVELHQLVRKSKYHRWKVIDLIRAHCLALRLESAGRIAKAA